MRTAILNTVVLAILVAVAATGPQAQSGVRAFVGARLVDGTGAPPVSNGVIVVRDGRIASVGPASAVAIPPGAERIDVSGRTILPGFVNAHGHVSDGPGAAGADARDNVIHQLRLYARYGVTTILSLGGEGPATLALRKEPPQGRARLFAAGPSIAANNDTRREFCVQRHIAILKPRPETEARFLCLLLESSLVYEQARRSIYGHSTADHRTQTAAELRGSRATSCRAAPDRRQSRGAHGAL